MTDRVRRNGQLSSCEPCRRSKLRCDHKRPICGRCTRRRLSQQQCHYHPAPMAKQLATESLSAPLRQRSAPRSIPTYASTLTEDSQAYEPINMNTDLMCFADPHTSHSQRSYTSMTRTGVALPQPSRPTEQIVSQGARLLNDILELVTEIGEPLEKFSILAEDFSIHGSLIEALWNATNDSIRDLLRDRSKFTLDSMSEAIFEQTSSFPVFPPATAAGTFEKLSSTQALRWDLLGLYCARIGVYLGGEKDKTSNFAAHQTWKSDRIILMQSTFQACIQCESLCNYLGTVNDITFWSIMFSTVLASWCFGDDSYHVIRLVGSMSSIFIALGFNKGVQSDSSVPLYMVEIRKRAIAWAHDHDKVFATFTSRRHFCTVELPLDLPDYAVIGTAGRFQRARENLDENGWNKNNMILPVSRLRVQLLLCMIREEVLELKIGPLVPDMKTRAEHISQKLKSTWLSIPPHMKYDKVQHGGSQNMTILMLQNLRLEYLYTEFLLHALLANSGESSRERLITTAHEVVNLALLPTRKRELLHSHRPDMEWVLVFYAMPCASVLTLELLRQNQHPEEQLIINRSGVIQDISVLISCCDSLTESGQSNYEICKQAQSIFSKSLDSILNKTEHIQRSKPREMVAPLHEQAGSMSAEPHNAVAQDPEWMAWLDFVGLQGDPWLESIIPEIPVE
ncbi:hypothetical protein N7478_008787 [Penicillium angulare]|uniref:uncharacterized protein n=1 Tax=Penicillium angulare TaxID=116970 RepID=UPI0025413FA8|nr:uncharacterized protein N7478_008787 [Penicillium angulare]KAJ5273662.1 hypothetical protein N7478_008787 [Penicillium angulare]